VYVITGWIDLSTLDRDEVLAGLANVTELSRQDEGCVDYWWAEDLRRPGRFRFFECWETPELFAAHRAQPFEAEFEANFVARCSGANAHVYEATSRHAAS